MSRGNRVDDLGDSMKCGRHERACLRTLVVTLVQLDWIQ